MIPAQHSAVQARVKALSGGMELFIGKRAATQDLEEPSVAWQIEATMPGRSFCGRNAIRGTTAQPLWRPVGAGPTARLCPPAVLAL